MEIILKTWPCPQNEIPQEILRYSFMGIFPLVFLLGNQVCRNISDQSLNIMQKHRKYEYEYEFFLVKNKVTGIFQKLKIIFS